VKPIGRVTIGYQERAQQSTGMHNALDDECKLPCLPRKNLPDISYDISEDLGGMEMGKLRNVGHGLHEKLRIYHQIKFFLHYGGIF